MLERDHVGQLYRNRIYQGQIVYFVLKETTHADATDTCLRIRKATVINAEKGLRYPYVLLWDNATSNPGQTGTAIAKSPRELFTLEEIINTVSKPSHQPKNFDDLIENDYINRLMVHLVLRRVWQRLGGNLINNPLNPEG